MPIRVERVTARYPRAQPVLRDVSFDLAPGSLIALLGPNGSGKSTLLRVLLGLLTPASGRVTLDDRPIGAIPAKQRARRMAYIPQRPTAAFDFTVHEIVTFGRFAAANRIGAGPPADGRRAEAEAALDRVELGDRADDPVTQLSVGQQQRVAVARALVQLNATRPGEPARPRVLLADEPVSAMDPRHAIATLGILAELAQRHAVLVVLHDLAHAARFAGRALLLDRPGADAARLIADGQAETVITPASLGPVYGVDFESRPVLTPVRRRGPTPAAPPPAAPE